MREMDDNNAKHIKNCVTSNVIIVMLRCSVCVSIGGALRQKGGVPEKRDTTVT